MYEKIRAYIKKYKMLEEGDTVIAGISGGADSVCLLYMLLALRQEWKLDVIAVHVNHMIRGRAADEDEAFVRRLCREQQVPLEVFRTDVAELAREQKLSEEEAGRNVRRDAFERTAREHGAAKIALAHHKNDNAETVLLNLSRGAGLKGLGGIRPRNGPYIRPLLAVSREEVEEYLEKKNYSYCTDATNSEDAYTRNRIRKYVIPYMEREVNEGFLDHVCGAAERMAELWEYIEKKAAEEEARCVCRRGSGSAVVRKEGYEQMESVLRPYVLADVLAGISGRRKDLEKIHLQALEELFEKQVGRMIDLPYGMKAYRCYEGIRIEGEGAGEAEEAPGAVSVRVFDAGEIEGDLLEAIPKTPYTKWFDYGIIKNSVTIRTRQSGDYITIDRQGRKQKLKQYFINEKIPGEKRDKILLAADGSHVLWVIGYRRGLSGEVTRNTRKILEITIDGGESDERDNQRISF